jgi:hypothetical protein
MSYLIPGKQRASMLLVANERNRAALTKSLAVNGAATTTYEVTGLTTGTWYFAVAADAADGIESAHSSIGSKTIQ